VASREDMSKQDVPSEIASFQQHVKSYESKPHFKALIRLKPLSSMERSESRGTCL
jgi:hypothetical protein